MHPNPIFRKAEDAQNIAYVRDRAFGTLAINASAGPLMGHVPFILSKDGRSVEAHLVRSNPILRALKDGPQDAVIAVTGPDAYISPDWYGVIDQVPTWNYVSVHLRGTLRALPQDDLVGVLERLSADMEARLAPKPAWTMGKMSDGVAQKMMRMIAPIAMDVVAIEGTWKLGQNKDEAARLGGAAGVAASAVGAETAVLSQLMQKPPC